ncbi:nucleotidyltransferase family protein [Arthrobacter sp. B3I4]|uniref:nucleotidyltransferase family protein n=1 Tax=Arthrobacter sp. B3I4 TaxID=3042267 RepID=UPI002784AD22|nr:nucleotidyltransferase family protein [Arthrobacter sp. B3I4]MDQ0756561.1 molybdenum cofactor cytidylyltransferase [Arthrobacter sp. B3I4]
MPSVSEPPLLAGTAAIILAAGSSQRLGRPKQLLPYGNGVLLDAAIGTARRCGFAQTVLALGGSAAAVLAAVDTAGCEVVLNPDYGQGCSSSITAALAVLRPETRAVVLLLGDQPGARAESVPPLLRALAAPEGPAAAVCRYDDGVGHPLAFSSALLPDLAGTHGDKAVWKLLEQRADDVVEVPTPGRVPLDVDTEEDYRRVLAELQGAR